jgi:hypothetical protein
MQHNDPILDGLTDAATGLVRKGHKEDAVMDGMLTLTVGWAMAHEGPQQVARRLYMLALRCASEAELMEQAKKGAVN